MNDRSKTHTIQSPKSARSRKTFVPIVKVISSFSSCLLSPGFSSHLTFHETALLFSATFKKNVENVAREILTDPVRISVGVVGEVCLPFPLSLSCVWILIE